MKAFVDESIRQSPPGDVYLVGAAVLIGSGEDDARSRLRSLLLPGQTRLHFRMEREERRMALLSVLSDLDLGVLAAWCQPVSRRRQGPARRACLTALAGDLDREGVAELVLERRDEAGNRLDRQTFLDARHGGIADLVYRFAAPEDEPLLWAADAVAGAVCAHVAGSTSRYYEALRPGVLVVRRTSP